MMSTNQERLVRRLLKSGGKLSLPGKHAPIQVVCTRAPGQVDIEKLTVSESAHDVATYRRWQSRELYPDLAELLDTLVPEQEVAA